MPKHRFGLAPLLVVAIVLLLTPLASAQEPGVPPLPGSELDLTPILGFVLALVAVLIRYSAVLRPLLDKLVSEKWQWVPAAVLAVLTLLATRLSVGMGLYDAIQVLLEAVVLVVVAHGPGHGEASTKQIG